VRILPRAETTAREQQSGNVRRGSVEGSRCWVSEGTGRNHARCAVRSGDMVEERFVYNSDISSPGQSFWNNHVDVGPKVMSMKNVKVLVKRRVKAIGIDLVLDSDYFLQSLSPSLFQQLRFPRNLASPDLPVRWNR
jgi:hypothetical protein